MYEYTDVFPFPGRYQGPKTLIRQRQHVWVTHMHKPGIVLNIISDNMCQVDMGNGPVLIHMTDLQDFEKAWDNSNGHLFQPAQEQSHDAFFDKIEQEFEARAEAARWHPENKSSGRPRR